ncbi:hypothetical protein K469DRAFT_746534 [Zopfia rhizophila CBS 207.26]|uniref:C2H2-type domain-containing protein n=1 Tax=Zopfia rhizophila CBS 207.26 TaxID=1314779 RepID=A0A6A6EI62_9PEZI|nr:hypothetical protein K469DRAFT_746534 [Zopfia rhizophila CBS 207.26]
MVFEQHDASDNGVSPQQAPFCQAPTHWSNKVAPTNVHAFTPQITCDATHTTTSTLTSPTRATYFSTHPSSNIWRQNISQCVYQDEGNTPQLVNPCGPPDGLLEPHSDEDFSLSSLGADPAYNISSNSRTAAAELVESDFHATVLPPAAYGIGTPQVAKYVCLKDLYLESGLEQYPKVRQPFGIVGQNEEPYTALDSTSPSTALEADLQNLRSMRGPSNIIEYNSASKSMISPRRGKPAGDSDGNPIFPAKQNMRNRILPIKEWLQANTHFPYPDSKKVMELGKLTGLTSQQVRICLSNQRARNKSPAADPGSQTNFSTTTHLDVSTADSGDMRLNKRSLTHSSSFIPFESLDTLFPKRNPKYAQQPSAADFGVPGFETFHNISAMIPLWRATLVTNPHPTDVSALLHLEHTFPAAISQILPIPQRKGKRQHPSRYLADGDNALHMAESDTSSDSRQECTKPFHCTVCPKAFKNYYGWRRHESGVHDFHITPWTCMPNGPLVNGISCVFCSELVLDASHLDHHNITVCLQKDVRARTFGRKDHVKQHILQVHLLHMDPEDKKAFQVPRSWKVDVDANLSDPHALWCGFCRTTFQSVAERMEHVADHFRAGADIEKDWRPRALDS